MKILGIDPGLSGAYALIKDGEIVCSGDLPRLGDGAQSRVAGALFGSVVKELAPDFAVIESVSAMPKQGVSSTFRFGRAVGTIEGVATALLVPMHHVIPGKWKGYFHLTGKPDGGAEASRQAAIQRWPAHAALFSRKKDHNRAEAALIALWFAETQHNPRKIEAGFGGNKAPNLAGSSQEGWTGLP
jgi:hypothetical protein